MCCQKSLHNKKLISYSFFVFLIFVLLVSPSAAAPSIQELKQGVVKITSTLGGNQRVGTGVIVKLDKDAAFIVTASHVIEGDQNPKISFFSKPNRPVSSKVIGLEGGDPRGLGVLMVEGDLPPDIHPLQLDTAFRVAGGENVTLIGFPRVSGTPWAVTPGTIAGSRGRDLSFTAPAVEGNSGGPLLLNGQVLGIITQVTSPFAHATPALITKFALESWGVSISDPPSQTSTAAATPSSPDFPIFTPPPKIPFQPTLDLTGSWKDGANPFITYDIDQDEDFISITQLNAGVPVLYGEGSVSRNTIHILFNNPMNGLTWGKANLTIAPDGHSISGRVSNKITGMTTPVSMQR